MSINAIRKTPDPSGVYYYVRKVQARHYPATDWEHSPDVSNVLSVEPRYWKYDGTSVVVEMSDSEKVAIDAAMLPSTYTLDTPNMYTEQRSGRFYLYANGRWSTESDDNYGPSYYQFAESGRSTGSDPTPFWKHQGIMVSKGDIIRRFSLSGRYVYGSVKDLEYKIVCRTPTGAATWQNGINNNAEMISNTVYKDTFYKPTNERSGVDFSGAVTHIHRRTIDLNFEIPEDGFISLYVKGIESSRTNFFPATYKYEIITPQ